MESLIVGLKERGFQVFLLTLAEKGDLHGDLESKGVHCFANIITKKKPLQYYISQIKFLIRFCKQHQINTVHSHLQDANLIAVIAQFFIPSRVVVFRHHFEFYIHIKGVDIARNRNEAIGEKVINCLAKEIVVPSSGVYNGMKKHERVDMRKVKVVPYVYNFSLYDDPDEEYVQQIRQQYHCKLLLIMCSRLILAKRHMLVLKVMKDLLDTGLDLKILILDEGPQRSVIENYVKQHHLDNRVFLLGFRKDFINYMAAADILIHPSLIEASNSVVKEMALLKKAVAVCEGIGDFSDYIEQGTTGFLMDQGQTEKDLKHLISSIYNNQKELKRMGSALRRIVLEKFSCSPQTLAPYYQLV